MMGHDDATNNMDDEQPVACIVRHYSQGLPTQQQRCLHQAKCCSYSAKLKALEPIRHKKQVS
jgi:hypothetical protein